MKVPKGSGVLSRANVTVVLLAPSLSRAALKDAARWMEEEEEEVKDWKAENRMNGSGEGKDADYGSPSSSLPTNDGFGRWKHVFEEKRSRACGLLIY